MGVNTLFQCAVTVLTSLKSYNKNMMIEFTERVYQI